MKVRDKNRQVENEEDVQQKDLHEGAGGIKSKNLNKKFSVG